MARKVRRRVGLCLYALIPVCGFFFSSEYGEPSLYAEILHLVTT